MYSLTYQDEVLQWETTFNTLTEALEYAGMEADANSMEYLWPGSLYDRLSGGEKCIRVAWSTGTNASMFLEIW
jgi:hypothetical protein